MCVGDEESFWMIEEYRGVVQYMYDFYELHGPSGEHAFEVDKDSRTDTTYLVPIPGYIAGHNRHGTLFC